MATNKDPILEMYIFEINDLIEKLEEIILDSEKNNSYMANIDEIFRIMHTLKGNSAMMLFDGIAALAHSLEDLFDYIRKSKPIKISYSEVTDLVLEAKDFIITEIAKIQNGIEPDGNAKDLIERVENKISSIKEENRDVILQDTEKKEENSVKPKFYISSENKSKDKICLYKAVIKFSDGCQMENVRAFTVLHNLNEIAEDISYFPEDIIENEESAEIIKSEGFTLYFKSHKSIEDIKKHINETSNIESADIDFCGENDFESTSEVDTYNNKKTASVNNSTSHLAHNVLSVSIEKIDMLMDLVGELVVSESMLTGSSDLKGLELENFDKSARQHRKIINDLQDVVMAVRMVPIAATFLKMNRVVRDMSKKLSKDVELKLVGEDTEVDKNIIENISDPLMHLIRNSMDHGLESGEERAAKGKSKKGTITLEAKNEGGDVYIKVKDDGKGLDKTKIYNKALENGITDKKIRELTDKEIYAFILIPGFSTNEVVTEYSGRGVGMDVVCRNIDKIRGTVLIDSTPGKGTEISVKIPLTLAIIDGMLIKVGDASYTIPTISINRSFKLKEKDLIADPDGNEMIMVRGQCYPLIRLYKVFEEETKVENLFDGIIVMVESGSNKVCLFADELIGQQQVVIKTLPRYIKRTKGIAGCTLLGNGNISLILDISSLIS